MTVTVFGIRHHGPGCARSLQKALADLQPDLVLVEGPPDADDEIAAVADAGMTPPVALLVWCPDDPQKASFYPFATFSPEWQALVWAVQNRVPARFCDLPCAQRFAMVKDEDKDEDKAAASDADDAEMAAKDPLQWLATADGYSDSERWWNDRIEESRNDSGLFAAIGEAVGAVRSELALVETRLSLCREAWMRRTLRAAQKEGFVNIAFVCGAWHAPAMAQSTRAADDALLKGLDKVKVRTTWTPWTYERLTRANGYGAGIVSPGWYEHLWHGGAGLVPRWLVRAARLLRQQDLPASSASVIEATRLANSLASLRGRPVPGLPELEQAIRTVLCGGESTPLQLLARSLFVGDRIGELPAGIARLPLEEDLLATQKSLRLKPTAGPTRLELDLREDGGRARSVFLHRLLAMQLPWGEKQDAGRTRGSFKEAWSLQWRPEFALALVDASAFGNTVVAAAENRLVHAANETRELAELVPLLDHALLADLPVAVAHLLAAVQGRSAETTDTSALLAAIPPLVQIARYGSVRATDVDAVRTIVGGLVVRVHVGLASAGCGIDDDAARALTDRLRAHHGALRLLGVETWLADADAALQALVGHRDVHAQVRGLAVQLLRERGFLGSEDVARHLGRELSAAAAPRDAAAWLDGFLGGNATVLAHDPTLLGLLDGWVAQLSDEHFHNVLPLVRRTLGAFTSPERRQVAQALRSTRGLVPASARATAIASLTIDAGRAMPAIDAVARLLDLPTAEAMP